MRDLSQLPQLMQDYEHLSRPSVLECAKREHPSPSDEEEAFCLVAHARRVVASAVVATLALHPTQVENLESELLRWAYRAITLEDSPPFTIRLRSNFLIDDAISLVARCFEVLAPYRIKGWQVGFARTAALMLLNAHQPARRLANVPLLLVQNECGRVAHLAMELLPNGFGDLFPMPSMFRTFGASWRQAVEQVRQRVKLPDGYDVLWEVAGDVSQIDGASTQAAFQVVLTLLCNQRLYDTGCAIGATVDDNGRLRPVEGIVGEHGSAGPKLLAGKQARLTRIVISTEDFRALSPQVLDSLQAEPFPLQVVGAETIEQAIEFTSSEATGLQDYFEQVITLPDREETLPAYMGGRKRTELYVEPDVSKRERRAEPRLSFFPKEGLNRRDVETSTRAERIAPEARDYDEAGLYGERYTEKRVAWAEERKRMVQGEVRRIVILAPPGQGKSLLAEMEVGKLAREASQLLITQQARLDSVPLPLVVRLDALANGGIRFGESPEQALRRALASVLQEQGYPEAACRYLAEHAHEERVWLFLDALDEVDEGEHETLGKFFGVLKGWRCRVIILSRPYGYEKWRLPFDVVEYRLAPFSSEQMRAFVEKWFRSPRYKPMNDLLTHSPSVQQVSQSPFLLTLLCAVVEQEEVSPDITRTQLYDRSLRLVLGGEERAAVWLPLLRELAWRMVVRNPHRPQIATEDLLELLRTSKNRPPVQNGASNLSDMEKAHLLLDELLQKRLLCPILAYRAYVFPHPSFAEFLAGWYLAELVNKAEAESGDGWDTASIKVAGKLGEVKVKDWIDKKAWLPEWQEVVIFFAGKLEDPSPLLKLLADKKKDDHFRHRLALAALCLPEVKDKSAQPHLQTLTSRIAIDAFNLWCENEINDTPLAHLTSCLPALAQGSSDTLFPELLKRLQDPNEDVRRATAWAVGEMGSAAATEAILNCVVELMQNPKGDVRFAAVRAVGKIGSAASNEAILDRLVELLRDPDWWVRSAAAKALEGMMAQGVRIFRRTFRRGLLQIFRRRRAGEWEVRTVSELSQ